MADPSFKLPDAIVRFRKGYTPDHFSEGEADGSVRGSRRGEMIARCVVESGTSSYYSAMRDATEEPLLQEIAGRIAAERVPSLQAVLRNLEPARASRTCPLWKKLWIAIGRIRESDDDELAFAYYCANVPVEDEASKPYNRKRNNLRRLATAAGMTICCAAARIQKLVQMVVKVIGANPHGWLAQGVGALLWRQLQQQRRQRRVGNGLGARIFAR